MSIEKSEIKNVSNLFEVMHYKIVDLVGELTEEELVLQSDFENKHAAWVIGHLSIVRDLVLFWTGNETVCPENWDSFFGNNKNPITRYTTVDRDILMDTFERSFKAVNEVIRNMDRNLFSIQITESFHSFPSKGHGVLFETTFHEGIHFGQLLTLVNWIKNKR
ncbi:MAG: DinB family protein [bacterium]|nr:DinB family protein [bacterium]